MASPFGIVSVSPKKDDHPFTPFVHLELTHYSPDTTGRMLLSPQLMTDQEVDYYIDLLIKELNELRARAKRALRKNEWLAARRV